VFPVEKGTTPPPDPDDGGDGVPTKIGYQDGIESFFDWYRKQPGVPQRGPGYDPNDINTWPWPDKLQRTIQILKDDHDAALK